MVVEIISIVMNQRFRDFQTVQNSITKKKNKNNQEIELLKIYYPPVEQPECGFVMWNVT